MTAREPRTGERRLAELAALVTASWAENVEPGFAHDLASLRALGAGTPAVEALTARIDDEDGRLVACALGLPRDAFVTGMPARLSLVTEVTVASGQKGRGLGGAVLSAGIVRARDQGLDGALWYAVQGSPMDKASPRALNDSCLQPLQITQLSFLRGLPRAAGPDDGASCDPSRATEILARSWKERAGDADVARTGDSDAARAAACGHDSVAVSLSAGSRAGAVIGRLMRLASQDASWCLVVDESCWNDLGSDERLRLARATLSAAARRGALLCSVALTVQDATPWRQAGLRLSPRRMNAWLAWWRPLARTPGSLLFDVT